MGDITGPPTFQEGLSTFRISAASVRRALMAAPACAALDVCAAPGGKLYHAEGMENEGELLGWIFPEPPFVLCDGARRGLDCLGHRGAVSRGARPRTRPLLSASCAMFPAPAMRAAPQAGDRLRRCLR